MPNKMPEKAVITAAAVLQGPSSCHYAATNHSHISAWVFSTNKNVNIQDCVWILRFLENSAWPMISAIQPEFTSKARGCKLYLEQVLLWSPLIEYHAYPYPCALPWVTFLLLAQQLISPLQKWKSWSRGSSSARFQFVELFRNLGIAWNCKAERIPRKCKEHEMWLILMQYWLILIDIDEPYHTVKAFKSTVDMLQS